MLIFELIAENSVLCMFVAFLVWTNISLCRYMILTHAFLKYYYNYSIFAKCYSNQYYIPKTAWKIKLSTLQCPFEGFLISGGTTFFGNFSRTARYKRKCVRLTESMLSANPKLKNTTKNMQFRKVANNNSHIKTIKKIIGYI